MSGARLLELPETVDLGRRLGRHVEHDPHSRDYPAEQSSELFSVIHARELGPLDQGNVGSCTGHAMVGLLMTAPFARPAFRGDDDTARLLYQAATHIDGLPGSWPEDTGSTGLAVAKAARDAGFIAGYRHAFGIDQALRALCLAPVIIGINWYDGFDTPDDNAVVEATGEARGGHEVELLAINVERELVTGMNSWGPEYGHGGLFSFSFATFERLLAEDGDVTTMALADIPAG